MNILSLYAYHWFRSVMILVANTRDTERKGRINGILHDIPRIIYNSFHAMGEYG